MLSAYCTRLKDWNVKTNTADRQLRVNLSADVLTGFLGVAATLCYQHSEFAALSWAQKRQQTKYLFHNCYTHGH